MVLNESVPFSSSQVVILQPQALLHWDMESHSLAISQISSFKDSITTGDGVTVGLSVDNELDGVDAGLQDYDWVLVLQLEQVTLFFRQYCPPLSLPIF